ncbi:RsmB/NOP family class I SAM-dependent RNA methyltransferase [bacterium]|nr:RsmB/NOP family class I SAM-dependent RNA methyltransferase [bacterium]
MTPAARYASAIAVLDDVLAGASAEKCLTSWARANRYAGSKDRAAVRDHVFDVLRRKRSLAALGGGMSGRSLVLGLIRHQGIDHNDVFGAGGYAPHALSDDELSAGCSPQSEAELHDLPDWLWPIWEEDLGLAAAAAARALQDRGPVTLRVNLRRGSRENAIAMLAEDGIVARVMDDVKTGLQVVENERRIHLNRAYLEGYVDLQDLASQEAVAGLEIADAASVLDYCAGGGGKALALADQFRCTVSAHDIAVARMVDIPARADRAGVTIAVLETAELTQRTFDVVFVDAPCSGSGTWRRAPEAKWAISSEKLHGYSTLQLEVLSKAAELVAEGGQLIYATCSVLNKENGAVLAAFLAANSSFVKVRDAQRLPDALGDGFFHAVLRRR